MNDYRGESSQEQPTATNMQTAAGLWDNATVPNTPTAHATLELRP